ncbi:MAG: hypothetical protein AB7V16_11940 [Vulcanibacillus sp.]
MSLQKKYKYLLYVVLFSLLIFFPQHKILGEDERLIDKKINQWIEQIHQIEPTNEIYTKVLNDDLKLVYYSIKNNYRGYLLLDKDDKILEYGEGENIPYQESLIINADIQKYELINLKYFSPIENYWELNTDLGKIFIEGSSGEWLFDLEMLPNKALNSVTIDLDDKIDNSYINKKLKFNPYENLLWLVANGMQQVTEKDDLKNLLLNDQKIIFVGEKYNHEAEFACSIIGYHTFQKILFVSTYDFVLNTTRYISYDELNNYGKFFIYSK